MKDNIKHKITHLIEAQKSLVFSTLDNQNTNSPLPETSYAPYYCDLETEKFYVLLSDLVSHSANIRNHPKASIMIIEDELKSEQIFARTRLQYDVKVQRVTNEVESNQAIQALQRRFGEIIDIISSLADFNLYEMLPKQGKFVEGFGKAFTIEKELFTGIAPAMQNRQKNSDNQ